LQLKTEMNSKITYELEHYKTLSGKQNKTKQKKKEKSGFCCKLETVQI